VAPKLVELEYGKAIARVLQDARAVAESLARRWLPSSPTRHDAVTDDFDREVAKFFEMFRPAKAQALAEKFASQTTTHADAQLKKQAQAALGVPVFTSERGLAATLGPWLQENVALIRSIPSKYFDEVEVLVARAVASGQRWEDLAKELQKRFAVAEDRAKLVARDQVGKLYGNIQRLRQQNLGVERYVWRTVHDNRVRPEHAERDGQTFQWSKPPLDGHPGHAINCRCFAEPDFSDLLSA
jgi:SPP1 gp7 family putative phage head morphogenesis protein